MSNLTTFGIVHLPRRVILMLYRVIMLVWKECPHPRDTLKHVRDSLVEPGCRMLLPFDQPCQRPGNVCSLCFAHVRFLKPDNAGFPFSALISSIQLSPAQGCFFGGMNMALIFADERMHHDRNAPSRRMSRLQASPSINLMSRGNVERDDFSGCVR